ncbi:acetyl-CoA acyltransferase 2, partial [Baffinella frigidus]
AADLGVIATNAALQQAKLDPALIDDCIFGNVSQTAQDTAYLARHVGLRAGMRKEIPALTLNRLCGSGFESILTGAKNISIGESGIVACGGAENMSMAPYALRDIRTGTKFPNDLKMEDTLWSALNDQLIKMPMALTAEKLGEQFGITREQCDEYALRSQHAWQKAQDAGLFASEIAPVTIEGKKGSIVFGVDEHPRGGKATMESMTKLKSIFKKDGLVTAANASGISDGAGMIIIASEKAVKQHNLTPLARLVGYSSAGVDPTIMGHGPVPAINNALKVRLPPPLSSPYYQHSDATPTRIFTICNLNGGAIAMGHPTGCSGSRIMAHLTYEMARKNIKYGVGSACCGGGQVITTSQP